MKGEECRHERKTTPGRRDENEGSLARNSPTVQLLSDQAGADAGIRHVVIGEKCERRKESLTAASLR